MSLFCQRLGLSPGIAGVTFSGGEPFQQASVLLELCEYLKLRRPPLSIGASSGYALREPTADRFHFAQIQRFLYFGVFGRLRQSMAACDDQPLCGSPNQEVVFFTDRHSPPDLEPQGFEVSIDARGAVVTDFPPRSHGTLIR